MQVVETAGDTNQLIVSSKHRIGFPMRQGEPVAIDLLLGIPSRTPVCFRASSIETQCKTRTGSAPRLRLTICWDGSTA